MSAKSSDPFSRSAEFYDLFYAEKDYDAEAAWVLRELPAASEDRPLLEIGCGTGEFTKRFAAGGWSVIGVDPSSAMLDVARRKRIPQAYFHCGYIQELRERHLPAAVAMFGVLSYACTSIDKELETFKLIRKRLARGGTLVFDVMHAGRFKPFETFRRTAEVHPSPAVRVEREIVRGFDPATSCVMTEMRWKVVSGVGGGVGSAAAANPPAKWNETHKMRAFSPPNLDLILRTAGFDVRSIDITRDGFYLDCVAVAT